MMVLLSRFKSGEKLFKLVSTFERKKNHKKIIKAKLIIPVRLPILDSIYTMIKFRKGMS